MNQDISQQKDEKNAPSSPAKQIADLIEGLVRGGKSINAAVNFLKSGYLAIEESLLMTGRLEYERRRNLILVWDDQGDTVVGPQVGSWYGGPTSGDVFWPPLWKQLKEEIPDGCDDVDQASSRVISLGSSAGDERIDTRGLVLGYVQSGKTTNFMSVIAKAADVGYKLIIVLSGQTDNLRQQTQDRIQHYLLGSHPTRIHPLTTLEKDFSEDILPEALLNQDDLRFLAVVKKNPARLSRLNKWLKKASATTLASCPILIIDDEADQASIDVGTKRQSTINALIRELLSHPKSAYIAYTATPFANLLIDPKDPTDLYPRTFVVSLPRPDAYFGPERIFGTLDAEEGTDPDDGLDIVRTIPDSEVSMVRPPTGKNSIKSWTADVSGTMRSSILWFLLATTARRIRTSEVKHSSMLIHTSMRAVAHVEIQEAVDLELNGIRGAFNNNDAELKDEIEALWTKETARVAASLFSNSEISLAEVLAKLPETLEATKVIVDNYLSTERLNYDKENPSTAIVIGGNTLSRGLTLEGLISSYFVRASSAYDTLLQMGRWFGYRKGYEDLVRIWMTDELRRWFTALATVEAEIRDEIEVYAKENKDPSQLPVRIRTHPQMAVTSAAKMKNAIKARVTFSGHKIQTILFSNDQKWLDANVVATKNLVQRALALGHREDELERTSSRGFRKVPAEIVLQFLDEYSVHEDARTFKSEPIKDYIRSQNERGLLDEWNVVFVERQGQEDSDLSLGLERPLKLLRRRKHNTSTEETINLKAIASRWDRIADLKLPRAAVVSSLGLADESKVLDRHLRTIRSQRGLDKTGLLIIYPINKNSEDKSRVEPDAVEDARSTAAPAGKSERHPLQAPQHLIGVGLLFPESKFNTDTIDYISAKVSPDYLDLADDELNQADARDEELAIQEENAAK